MMIMELMNLTHIPKHERPNQNNRVLENIDQLFIDSEGGIYPCGGVAEEDFKLGNIQDEKAFEQLLNTPDTYYRQVIDRILKQNKFIKCQDCNVREFCWSCISEVLSKSVINEVFEIFCENNYRKWNKLVWANRKRD